MYQILYKYSNLVRPITLKQQHILLIEQMVIHIELAEVVSEHANNQSLLMKMIKINFSEILKLHKL